MLTRSRTLTTLVVMLGCALAQARAQEDQARHQRSTADYIEALEDPGRDAWPTSTSSRSRCPSGHPLG